MPRLNHNDINILFLELQPQIVASSRTVPEESLRRAVRALVTAGQALHIPIVASVVPLGPAAPAMIGEVGSLSPLLRTTISAFDDTKVRDELASSGRKVLLLGGVSSEIAIFQSAMSARDHGYEVHVLADCCGGLSERTEVTAFRQLETAGATVSNVSSCLTSLVSDMASPSGQTIMAALATLWSWDMSA